MYFFAHIGIGQSLASPLRRGLPERAFVLGTILPDLIDKPVYLGVHWFLSRRAAESFFLSGSRTFGHTALFDLSLALIACLTRSKVFAALALGVATHLLLDNIANPFDAHWLIDRPIRAASLLWPFLGWRFPMVPYYEVNVRFGFIQVNPFYLSLEVIGMLLLLRGYWFKRIYHMKL